VLQPVRSFKIRGAGNAILQATDAELADGVLTASAGNMAQGVAYAARLRGVPATIVVPEHAPQTKIDAIERYGGSVIKVPYEEWWQVLVTGRYDGAGGLFVHPVDNDRVMAGNGTIGLELLEQLDDFDTVVVPYGGGGLLTGIASAVKAERPEVQFVVAEPETGAPVAATLAAGTPTAVEYTPSFVDGSGSRELIPRVWEQASQLIDAAVNEKVDGLVVSMANPDALKASIEKAVAAGIPVITINSGQAQSATFGALAHVGQDETIAGQGAGEKMKAAGVTNALCVIQEAGNVGLEAIAHVALETFTAMINVAGEVPVDGSGEEARTAQLRAA